MRRIGVAYDGVFWVSPVEGAHDISTIKPFIENELLREVDETTDIAIIMGTEAYTIEVCKAIKELDIERTGKTMVIGFDFSQAMYDLIKTGEVYGTVGQNPYLMGYESVYMMMKHLTIGRELAEFAYIPFTVVKQDNLETEEVKTYLRMMEIEI